MAFDPLAWLDQELQSLSEAQLRRHPSIRGAAQGARVVIDGRELINFGSNDYLGLAHDGRLAKAVEQAVKTQGWGSGASPLVTGRSSLQAELERHLASFEGTEAAILFPSGFAANVGTIGCLAGRGDVVFSDAKNHASLIDGCRLSRADVRIYPHADLAALRSLIHETPCDGRRFLVTDSLFSMDGDFAPLPDLVELAEAHQAVLIVDEAHATGVIGSRGRGVCELMDVESYVPVRIGTLSKALGSVGGFVAGSRRLIDWLFNRARPQVFSTALPAACAAATLAALQIVRSEPQRRERVMQLAAALRQQLHACGIATGNSHSQIVPILLGDPARTMQAAEYLRTQGMYVPGIRPPTVPKGESLLRVSLTAGHSEAQLTQLVAGLKTLQ